MATATAVMFPLIRPRGATVKRSPKTPNPALTARRAGRSGKSGRHTSTAINCIPLRLGSVVPAVDHVAPLARIRAPPDGEILGVARARRSVRRHGVDLRLADGEAQVAAGRDIPRHRLPENPPRSRKAGGELAPNRSRSIDDPRL